MLLSDIQVKLGGVHDGTIAIYLFIQVIQHAAAVDTAAAARLMPELRAWDTQLRTTEGPASPGTQLKHLKVLQDDKGLECHKAVWRKRLNLQPPHDLTHSSSPLCNSTWPEMQPPLLLRLLPMTAAGSTAQLERIDRNRLKAPQCSK